MSNETKFLILSLYLFGAQLKILNLMAQLSAYHHMLLTMVPVNTFCINVLIRFLYSVIAKSYVLCFQQSDRVIDNKTLQTSNKIPVVPITIISTPLTLIQFGKNITRDKNASNSTETKRLLWFLYYSQGPTKSLLHAVHTDLIPFRG